jgi:hypothetical protein
MPPSFGEKSKTTHYIAVGIILSQIDDEKKRCPAQYGSLPMEDAESYYSQPKLDGK